VSEWIVLKGQALRDLVKYLREHEDDVDLETLFVTVIGRMPKRCCMHVECYNELEEAARNRRNVRVARKTCGCGAEIELYFDPDSLTWVRDPI